MNINHSLSLGNKGNILLGIYILLCLGITINMSFLITDTPLTGDAAQNFRLAYNKYKYGILSTDGENKEATLTHSNYREPLPPYVTALFMAVHPQVNKSQSYLSFKEGRNTIYVKQVNLLWIMALLLAAGGFTYAVTKSYSGVLLVYALTVVYFIRFGNHFDDLNTELPAALFILLTSWLLMEAVKKRRNALYFLSGVSMGMLILVKAIFLYISPFLLIYLIFLHAQSRGKKMPLIRFRETIFVFSGICMIILPWMIRNKIHLGNFEVTQRGGIVLHYRAIHNQMTGDEIKGALHFYGPETYKAFSTLLLGIHEKDFEEEGVYRRLNRSHEADRETSDLGNPEDAISFYAYTRAERRRLMNKYSEMEIDSPFRAAEKDLSAEAKELILQNPVKHVLMTAVFLWRGTWCFPNSTIPIVGNTLQIFINNTVNFLAFFSFLLLLIIAYRTKDRALPLMILLPVLMILLQAFVSHNIPRYSVPAIPISFVCLIWVGQYLLQNVNVKKSSS